MLKNYEVIEVLKLLIEVRLQLRKKRIGKNQAEEEKNQELLRDATYLTKTESKTHAHS
jgi:hypothetical protein